MTISLSTAQRSRWEEFRAFAAAKVAPDADRFDEDEQVPAELISAVARLGYLGLALPARYGGGEIEPITYGLLHEELGRASASVQGLVNVHNMAAQAIVRWGNPELRERLVPPLAEGACLAAFAISEPEVGSDAAAVQTEARLDGDEWVIDGTKKWITCGQRAEVFVVLARCEGKLAAFAVEAFRPGFSRRSISGLLGCRGYMLAELHFQGCRVPRDQLLGRVGFGLSHVAASGLDAGRYALAWGCVGVAQACLDESLDYTSSRIQFGRAICEHELIQRMISDMITKVRAARLLCVRAGELRAARDPRAIGETSIAKYFASTALAETASDAVQVHGANGCSRDYPVQRYLRDAKMMEMIEGSTQIQQIVIAKYGYQERASVRAPAASGEAHVPVRARGS